MTTPLRVGLVGAGNISTAYLDRAPGFRGLRITAVADVVPAAAEQRAAAYGLRALPVDALMADPDIDLVLNLTVPAAHFDISRRALMAGKHVYSEKPFVLSLTEGQELARLAAAKRLRLGSAPDTVLGGAHQQARHLIDQGVLGRITSGTCFVQSHGMEMWHPNPDFFFLKGGGPVLDLGPYYIANLVQLIGPVRRVGAMSATPSATRTITSQPRAGETIPVETPTTIHALLDFHNGAIVTFVASWDVWQHDLAPMALYGEKGTLHVPDPNFFGGALRMTEEGTPVEVSPWNHPLGVPNRETSQGLMADYRTTGLADMAQAIAEGRPHRCNGDYALHVVEVMTAILQSGEEGRFLTLETICERPAPLGPDAARALMA